MTRQCPARAIVAERIAGDQQLSEAQVGVKAAAGADSQDSLSPDLDQLVHDDRRARSAHAGALDAQQGAVTGSSRVAPEAAVVVEHLGLVQQPLRHSQRSARVSWQ